MQWSLRGHNTQMVLVVAEISRVTWPKILNGEIVI